VSLYTGTRADCETIRASRVKLIGPPKKGTQIGDGIHVPMPATWDSLGDVPIGWTGYQGEKLVTGVTWSVDPGGDECDAALKLASADTKLTPAEKTLLQTAVTATKVAAPTEPKTGDTTPK
jgi:hypothetical protein